MEHVTVIEKTAEHVKKKFTEEYSGHDWWHMYRVWNMAKRIAQTEPDADSFVVELGALLHDIADWKFHNGDEEAGPKAAREWLAPLGVEEPVIRHIEEIIRNVSFKGAHVAPNLATKEGQIIHDADKLDAIGALGIARTFAYGGANNRTMHDPERQAQLHDSFADYAKSTSTSIGHFHEKLLLLKNRMFTDEAKRIAEARHEYMHGFLQEFDAEWQSAR